MKYAIISALALSTSIGCAPITQEELDEELKLELELELGETQQAIDNGTLVTSNTTCTPAPCPYSGVVQIGTSSGTCTATKITATRFLTAGHCIADLLIAAGKTITISNTLDGVSVFSTSISTTVVSAAIHPFYAKRPFFNSSPDVGVFDVAATAVASIPTVTVSFGHVADLSTGTIVGYGQDAIIPSHSGKKQSKTFTAQTLGTFRTAYPSLNTETASGQYTTNILALGAGKAQTNDGDSGAPWLKYNTTSSRWEIMGVVHGGDPVDKDPPWSYLGRTHIFAYWLQDLRVNAFEGGNYGFFFNLQSRMCVTDSTGTTSSTVWQHFCDARVEQGQRWSIVQRSVDADGTKWFSLLSQRTGNSLCLAVKGGSTANYANMAMETCNATSARQLWKFVLKTAGEYTIRNKNSLKCLGTSTQAQTGGNTGQFASLTQNTCGNQFQLDQTWLFAR